MTQNTQPQTSRPTPDNAEIEYIIVKKRVNPLKRIGCIGMTIIWFMFLLTPLLLFALANQGQITIAHRGDIPDADSHPFLQVRLISEIDFRGLNITRSSIDRDSDNAMCIQTSVSYLLWQGEGDPATFCDCYSREDEDAAWTMTSTESGECP